MIPVHDDYKVEECNVLAAGLTCLFSLQVKKKTHDTHEFILEFRIVANNNILLFCFSDFFEYRMSSFLLK